jgi:hypothetical protein
MKQDVSPGVIAVVAVILVAVIGFFAYKTFGPHKQPLYNAQAGGTGGGSGGPGAHDPNAPKPEKGQSMSSGGPATGAH